ncbi:hypothetical protein CKM354_000554400 [Cercospora kikuchii]|uniref:Aspartate aminotransferase n=1 Tax=Cercospora kikuchii TaxID=84275 RepID=A0A9P3FGX4_9PEZI|nr:uncharacterized protein CKM354_000554400 [Cercospora kikuchii]GIZ42269.1 hypothetical protein CKM354_000554400 [Cercospora kikuchii]
MSCLENLPDVAADAAFALIEQYKADSSPHKVDLSPGFYRDEQAKPWTLPSVQQAERALYEDPSRDHEHLPLLGHAQLLSKARDLIFGVPPDQSASIASIQTIAGTGANHLGALLLAQACRPQTVWISDPSWINHTEIWKIVDDGIQRRSYPYFDPERFTIDFDGMLSTLGTEAQEGDVVILHGCAHNPTGLDLDKAQWREIAALCEKKRLIPFFDVAYQGFASGDLNGDAWPILHFYRSTSVEFLVAQSFSKNFGLYGQRVGVLHVACRTETAREKTVRTLTRLSRAEITSCPIHGARIVARILSEENLTRQWQDDLLHMGQRMLRMRTRLVSELQRLQTPGSWQHMLTDVGMFSMTGLLPEQIEELREQHHVYLLPSGRMSVTGLTEYNVDYVAKSFHSVLVGCGT